MYNIKVYQSYYLESHKAQLDSCFVHIENILNPEPSLYEYYLFKKVYDAIDKEDADFLGVFSPKYNNKSGLSGDEVISFVQKNAQNDIILFNPFPQENDVYYNIWDQGEFWHPGITSLAQEALDACGLEIHLDKLSRNREATVFCNYWVASRELFVDFMKFVTPVVDYMCKNKDKYFQTTAYLSFGQYPFFPFIFERLLSTYLMIKPVKFVAYQYPDSNLPSWKCFSKLQIELHKRLSQHVSENDVSYGNSWPDEVRKKLKDLRKQVFIELQALNFSEKVSY